MKAGFWGNYETGRIVSVEDHELWIRHGNNAAGFGVSSEVIARFGEFPDREDFLRFLLASAPLIRVRGHGAFVTFEFDSADWDSPLKLIEKWCRFNAGPYLGLNIVNFHRAKAIFVLWKDFAINKICR